MAPEILQSDMFMINHNTPLIVQIIAHIWGPKPELLPEAMGNTDLKLIIITKRISIDKRELKA